MREKHEVLEILKSTYEAWEKTLSGKREAEIAAPRASGDWSVKDVVAHLMAWQQVSIARLRAALLGTEPEYPAWLGGTDPFEAEEHTADFNARIYAIYRDKAWSAVHQAWREGFQHFIQQAEQMPAEDIFAAGRYAWLRGYALAAVFQGSCGHHQEHLEDLPAPPRPLRQSSPNPGEGRFKYPPTPTVDQVDDYHGTLVGDPYRWLEDTDAPETKAWIEAQNAVTFAFLEKIPSRTAICRRITELWDYPKASAPVRRGSRTFQLRNTGLQNQDVLFVQDSGEAKGRVLLDPNTLSEDGTVALNTWEVSKDGDWLAYAISASGSDWLTWRVRAVSTGEDLPDEIRWSKFSGAAWRADGTGFYYGRYAEPVPGEDYTAVNDYQKLYYHQRGTNQDQDILIYARPDEKEWGFGAEVTDDGDYLVLTVSQGTDRRNRVFYQDLRTHDAFVELIPDLEAAYHFVGNDGTRFYFRTDLGAPRGRLMAIDVLNPGREAWQTLIPESQDVLEMALMVHDEFIALYMHDAQHLIKRFALEGTFLGAIEFPAPGAISNSGNLLNLTGRREDAELFYGFWSFLYPQTVFRYDFDTQTSEVVFSPDLDFDPDRYETRQVFVPSKDGTRVPMFLTHKRDLAADGNNPVLLYGYGGFDIALTPSFIASRIAWLERGGVYASANLRGGGEYGEEWHAAGSIHQKQNVFDDFIACAEWLIKEKITSTPKLAILGGSNGGLLVGACLTQRPDLFGACVPRVGVMDMLRFHKFTIGWAWVSDYGSSDDPAEFATLYAYSPLHNLRAGTHYPATLVTTSDHDDRVVPGHSFKFAAALQAAQTGDAPVLIRIQTKAGHGLGKPTAIVIQEETDIYAFLDWVLSGH